MSSVKPDNCTCSFPAVYYQNGSGHQWTCPVHIRWEYNFIRNKQAETHEYPLQGDPVDLIPIVLAEIEELFKPIEGPLRRKSVDNLLLTSYHSSIYLTFYLRFLLYERDGK